MARAKGAYKPGSVIDLAIIGAVSMNDQLMLMSSLDDLDMPYQFDVLSYAGISDADVRSHIDRVGITIFTRTSADLV